MLAMFYIGPMELICIGIVLLIMVGGDVGLILFVSAAKRRGRPVPLVPCPQCGRNVPAVHAHCPNCGQALPK